MEENDREELASIPWDYLATESRPDIRRWVTIGSVAVAVLAVSASASRTLWSSDPAPLPLPAPVEVEAPTTTTTASPLTEADLFGFDADAARLAAVGHAQWFVHRYMTAEGEGPRTFVESIIPVEAVQVGAARFAVVLVVRSLHAGEDEGYVRSPDLSMEVVVDVGEQGPRVIDWPGPPSEETPAGPPLVSGLTPASPPREMLERAAAGGGEFVEAATDGRAWRFLFERVDQAGISRLVAVWLSADGYPIPAGGFQP